MSHVILYVKTYLLRPMKVFPVLVVIVDFIAIIISVEIYVESHSSW